MLVVLLNLARLFLRLEAFYGALRSSVSCSSRASSAIRVDRPETMLDGQF